MTNEQTSTLVFKDQAGEYYLLPQATLEQGRVPEERKAEVERLVAEAEGDDVSGHLLFAVANTAKLAFALNDWLEGKLAGPQEVPTIQFPT